MFRTNWITYCWSNRSCIRIHCVRCRDRVFSRSSFFSNWIWIFVTTCVTFITNWRWDFFGLNCWVWFNKECYFSFNLIWRIDFNVISNTFNSFSIYSTCTVEICYSFIFYDSWCVKCSCIFYKITIFRPLEWHICWIILIVSCRIRFHYCFYIVMSIFSITWICSINQFRT